MGHWGLGLASAGLVRPGHPALCRRATGQAAWAGQAGISTTLHSGLLPVPGHVRAGHCRARLIAHQRVRHWAFGLGQGRQAFRAAGQAGLGPGSAGPGTAGPAGLPGRPLASGRAAGHSGPPGCSRAIRQHSAIPGHSAAPFRAAGHGRHSTGPASPGRAAVPGRAGWAAALAGRPGPGWITLRQAGRAGFAG